MAEMPVRSVRAGDEWDAAKKKAEENGKSISYAVQALLKDYVAGVVDLPDADES